MIIVDNKLNQRELDNNPIRVGIIGAGEMSKGLINQITKHTQGMKVIATYNRSLERPIYAYKVAGIENYKVVKNELEFKEAINSNLPI